MERTHTSQILLIFFRILFTRSRRQPERCVAGFFGLLLRRPLCHLPPAHRQPSGHGAATEEAMSQTSQHCRFAYLFQLLRSQRVYKPFGICSRSAQGNLIR